MVAVINSTSQLLCIFSHYILDLAYFKPFIYYGKSSVGAKAAQTKLACCSFPSYGVKTMLISLILFSSLTVVPSFEFKVYTCCSMQFLQVSMDVVSCRRMTMTTDLATCASRPQRLLAYLISVAHATSLRLLNSPIFLY